MTTPKAVKLKDAEESSRLLEHLLDALYGEERGPQIPGHYGNGVFKETHHSGVRRDTQATARQRHVHHHV
jgi:hypothetical protein